MHRLEENLSRCKRWKRPNGEHLLATHQGVLWLRRCSFGRGIWYYDGDALLIETMMMMHFIFKFLMLFQCKTAAEQWLAAAARPFSDFYIFGLDHLLELLFWTINLDHLLELSVFRSSKMHFLTVQILHLRFGPPKFEPSIEDALIEEPRHAGARAHRERSRCFSSSPRK